jgi:hypothetical protein
MQSAAQPQKDRQTLRIEQRTSDLEAAIRTLRLDLTEDHFSAVIGTLREAVNLSRGLPELEETVVLLGIELATHLLPVSARLAQSLLQETLEVDSQKLIPRELWTSIKNKEREEAEALTRPAPAPRPVTVKIAEPVIPARYQYHPAPAPSPAPPQPQRDWNRLATAATIIFTVGTLSTAAGLIWLNQSRLATRHPRTAAVKTINPDDQAWAAVNPQDPNLVESYLMRFPSGVNRARAVQAMAEIRLQHRQSAEVRDTLEQYAAAWNARQARLSPLKSLTLNLSPASTPRIEGDQATITCLRSVSEVDPDGAKKQTPAERVTFLLARRPSGWVIDKAFTPDPKKSSPVLSTPSQPF